MHSHCKPNFSPHRSVNSGPPVAHDIPYLYHGGSLYFLTPYFQLGCMLWETLVSSDAFALITSKICSLDTSALPLWTRGTEPSPTHFVSREQMIKRNSLYYTTIIFNPGFTLPHLLILFNQHSCPGVMFEHFWRLQICLWVPSPFYYSLFAHHPSGVHYPTLSLLAPVGLLSTTTPWFLETFWTQHA